MSALSLPVVVLALGLGCAFALAVAVYPVAAALMQRWPVAGRWAPVVAALPWLAAVAVVLAALLPGDPHLDQVLGCHCASSMPSWSHLCPVHPASAAGVVPFALLVVAVLIPGRLWALGELARQPVGRGGADPALLDLPERTALVVGWLRPSIVIDRQLWHGLDDDQRGAVLAHERAHIRRRDPQVLFVLLALTIVAPRWAAHRLVRSWLERSELAADAIAARQVGPLVLADALVRCARVGAQTSPLAPAWTGGVLERRIERLVAPQGAVADSADIGLPDLVLVGSTLALVVARTPWLHHQVEHLLNLSM